LIPKCAHSGDKVCDDLEHLDRIEFFSDKQIALITNHKQHHIEHGEPKIEPVSKMQWLSIGIQYPNVEMVPIRRNEFVHPQPELLKLLGFQEKRESYIEVSAKDTQLL
jgi:hypothetical protein